MSDPLAGKRLALNRREVPILVFEEPTCPVAEGDIWPLRSLDIEIGKVQRKLVKGRWRFEAKVIYHVPDVPRLPARQHGLAQPPQYVPNPQAAIDGVGDEGPPEWQQRIAKEGRTKSVQLSKANRNVVRAAERLAERRAKGEPTEHAECQLERAKRCQRVLVEELEKAA